MENKKQLIIVPPMSEALKKLNEVLEGIAGDENIEISMVDDLKELGQLLAATGQCLVLCSNAKKCATFLQENRFVISRSHSKVMLFTPKEIPAKTLVKFTKVGLTESILENSPPKTLLYKIKLQLRSIKSVSQVQEKEVIKNSTGAVEAQSPEEGKIKEKIITEQLPVTEVETKKRFDNSEENVIDYGTNLKGKIKPQEETIDTHWKSKRKTEEVMLDLDTEKAESSDNNEKTEDLDMYYRGKSKKTTNIDVEEVDYRKLKKTEYSGATEEEKEKKKSSFLDSYDEEHMKQKRLHQEVSYEDEERDLHESSPDLELTAAKKKTSHDYQNDDVDDDVKKAIATEFILDPAKPNTKEKLTDDLGGHYRGDIINTELVLEMEQKLAQLSEQKEYDNSELDLEKEKANELDIIAGKKKKMPFDYEEEDESKKTHDGEIDHLAEDNMNGEGETDHIETMMGGKTTTRKSRVETDAEDEVSEEKVDYRHDDEEETHEQSPDLPLTAGDRIEKKKEIYQIEDEELELSSAEQTNLDLLDAKKKKRDALEHSEINDSNALTELDLMDGEKTDSEKERNARLDEEDNIHYKKINNTQLDLEAAKKNNDRSKVDKIDTYYRSGESKKTEHSWDNLVDGKKDLKLDLLKNRKADQMMAGCQKNDLGEITIDYRKLKQEFDLISRGEDAGSIGAISSKGGTHLSEAEEDASFKVVEPDAKGLELAISMLTPLMDKTFKAKSLFAMIAEDMLDQYNGHTVFYSYKQSDNKYTETYCSFLEMPENKISEDRKTWWFEFKKSTELFAHYQSKSMSTWRSPEVIENNSPWEDVELPKWARQELADKRVELIFPYYDGVDKMGMALVFFPEGIKAEYELSILTSLELARTMLLDTIQRYQASEKIELVDNVPEQIEETPKKNILGFFGGIFGKKKAG